MSDTTMHSVTALVSEWPSGLKSAEEIAKDLGVSAIRLIDLAEGGFAPHHRIDGGEPLFRLMEIKKWVARNLIQRVDGKDLPSPVRVILDADSISDYRKVPLSIRQIENLKDITGEIKRTGIYFLCEKDEVVYVGQSKNFRVD